METFEGFQMSLEIYQSDLRRSGCEPQLFSVSKLPFFTRNLACQLEKGRPVENQVSREFGTNKTVMARFHIEKMIIYQFSTTKLLNRTNPEP